MNLNLGKALFSRATSIPHPLAKSNKTFTLGLTAKAHIAVYTDIDTAKAHIAVYTDKDTAKAHIAVYTDITEPVPQCINTYY